MNNNLIWLEEYKIGHATIDQQNQELFDLANQITNADQNTQNTSLNVLKFYRQLLNHFKTEENLMRNANCPDLNEHSKEHNQWVKKFTLLSTGIVSGEVFPEKISEFMHSLLFDHILNKDIAVAGYLESTDNLTTTVA